MNSKIYFLVSALFFLTIIAHAQSPYHFDWKKELSLTAIGGSTLASSFWVNANAKSLSAEQIAQLKRSDVPAFERFVTYNFSVNAQKASDVFLLSSTAIPALLFLGKPARNHFGQMAILYGETLLVTGGITRLTKTIFLRPRPLLYNENVSLATKQKIDNRYSFFSGHTSLTAMNYFFAAKVFSDFYPDSSWKHFVWGVAITAPALTGAFRVIGGKHFVTDVVVGYGVGAFIGYMIPHLHKNKKDKKLSFVPSANGLYLSWTID